MDLKILYIAVGLIVFGTYLYVRSSRIKRFKQDFVRSFDRKERSLKLVGQDSNNQWHVPNTDKLQFLGIAVYNFIVLKNAEKILLDSKENLQETTEALRESLVFKGLEQRNPDFDMDNQLEQFQRYLDSSPSVIKGDLGEQISAEQYREVGYDVEWPTNVDGTWKSNNPDYDFSVNDGAEKFKVNPKVGYDDNFSKIKQQAQENPDVLYEAGPQHAESIDKSGLDNIVVNGDLSDESFEEHLQSFKYGAEGYSQAKLQLVEGQEVFADAVEGVQEFSVEDLPLLSAAINGSRQFQLCREGLINPGEAVFNTVAKTAIKAGAIHGTQLLIGSMGLLGGPVGVVAASLVGAYLGSGIGQSIYYAFFSSELVSLLSIQTQNISVLNGLFYDDLVVKINQVKGYSAMIFAWKIRHPLQVFWPSRPYVLRLLVGEFFKKYKTELVMTGKNLQQVKMDTRAIQEQLKDIGFLGRLFGKVDDSEKRLNDINNTVLESIVKTGAVIRNDKLRRAMDQWECTQIKIVNEKKKLAA